MDPSPNKDQLLDLLYGELSPEEEADLRREIDDDEELADQWRALQASYEEITEAVPPSEELPQDVTDAILKAAESSAAKRRRDPPPAVGGWKPLLSSSKLMAISSAAAVCLAAGAFFWLTGQQVMEESAPEAGPVSIADRQDQEHPVTESAPQQESERTNEDGLARESFTDDDDRTVDDGEAEVIADLEQSDSLSDDGELEGKSDDSDRVLAMEDHAEAEHQTAPRRRRSPPEPSSSPEETDQSAGDAIGLLRDDGSTTGPAAGRNAAGISPDSEPEPVPEPEPKPEPAASPQADAEMEQPRAEAQEESTADLFGATQPDSTTRGHLDSINDESTGTDSEDETDIAPDSLLADAQRAANDGDIDTARTLLDRLLDDPDELDDEIRIEAQRLAESLETDD